MTLRLHILTSLAHSTSRAPLSTEELARGHSLHGIQDTLMEMYEAWEVCCCQMTKRDVTKVLWWRAGNVESVSIIQRTRAKNKIKAKVVKAVKIKSSQ